VLIPVLLSGCCLPCVLLCRILPVDLNFCGWLLDGTKHLRADFGLKGMNKMDIGGWAFS
jgi:hypothetical protein